MRILGVDPGTEATGFGVIDSDGDRCRLVEFGAVRAGKVASFSQKLLVIHRKLGEVIRRVRPETVVVENVFYAANVKSALRLGHVRGVTLLVGVEHELPLFEYSPLEVKQAVAGYGRASKEQIQEMVRVLLSLERAPTPFDAADALAVALCHANRLRFSARVRAAVSAGARPRVTH